MNNNIRLIQDFIDNDAKILFDNTKAKVPASAKPFIKAYLVSIHGKNYRFANVLKKCDVEWLSVLKEQSNIDAFAFNNLSSYTAKKLTERSIPFVSDSILYLPFLSFIVDENKLKPFLPADESFDPADQLISIYILINGLSEFSASDLVAGTGVSEITISRYIRKIESYGFLSYETTGAKNRKRIYKISDLSLLYAKVSPKFSNPVSGSVFLDSVPDDAKVLETSITSENLMYENRHKPHPVYAMYKKDIPKVEGSVVSEDVGIEEAKPQIYLFKYDVSRLSSGNDLDPISMKLAFPDLDEQTKDILDAWLGSFGWYK